VLSCLDFYVLKAIETSRVSPRSLLRWRRQGHQYFMGVPWRKLQDCNFLFPTLARLLKRAKASRRRVSSSHSLPMPSPLFHQKTTRITITMSTLSLKAFAFSELFQSSSMLPSLPSPVYCKQVDISAFHTSALSWKFKPREWSRECIQRLLHSSDFLGTTKGRVR